MKSSISFPSEISVEPWHGGMLHKIEISGCTAWIVEPPFFSENKYWFWLPEWPTAFPDRNGVKELLQMGFFMVHINVFGKFANDEALQIMYSLYEYLQKNGFEKKGAFIGMSLNPEDIHIMHKSDSQPISFDAQMKEGAEDENEF